MTIGIAVSANKQLQRTVIPIRWRGASAPFNYARAAHHTAARRRSTAALGGAMNVSVLGHPNSR
jgi:hypothetical protein